MRDLSGPARLGTFVSPANPATLMNVGILLRGQHLDEIPALEMALADPRTPYFRHWLTPAQYGAYFGAPPEQIQQTVGYLRSRGFDVVVNATNRRYLLARATAATVEKTFDTPIDVRQNGSQRYLANRFEPSIPPGLAWVQAVGGLDTYRTVHPHLAAPALQAPHPEPHATVNPGQFGFGPQDLYTAYDFNGSYNGAGTTIAIQVVRNFLPSDVFNYDSQFGISNSTMNRVFLTGTCPSPCPQPTSANDATEAALDTEVSHAAAQLATLDVVSVGDDLTDSQLLGFEYIANGLGHSVQVVSTSFGGCEFVQNPFDRDGRAAAVEQGVLEGETWVAASGDDGANDCKTVYKHKEVDFPAEIPEIVAVGGTSENPTIFDGNVTGYGPEYAWNDGNCSPPRNFGASGGGESMIYAKPVWQNNVTEKDSARDIPDVAALADPFQQTQWPSTCPATGGYYIDYALNWQTIGGTSASAPFWAGIFADLSAKELGNLGLVQPELYKLKNSAAYHQITTGDNTFNGVTGYKAGAGYNLVTGLGSPDETQFLALYSQALPPTPKPTAFPAPQPHPSQTPVAQPTSRAFVPVYVDFQNRDQDVLVFDATVKTQGKVLQTINGAQLPVDLAFNSAGTTVYILEGSGYIDTIDTRHAPYAIKKHVLNSDARPANNIAVTATTAYVTDWTNKDLNYLPLTGGAVQKIPLAHDPTSIVPNPRATALYAADSGSGMIDVIDTHANKFVQTLKVGMNPTRIAVNHAGTEAYVANSGDGTIIPVNVSGSLASLGKTIYVGGEPTAIAISADDSLAFVTNLFCPGTPAQCFGGGNSSNGTVEILTLKAKPVGVQCCIFVQQMPIAAAFEPTGHYLWVINYGSNSVSIIDTFTNVVVMTVPAGAPNLGQWGAAGSFVQAVP